MPRHDIDITVPTLAGHRAVVTGASDGIGLRIATRLAQAGAELVLPARSIEKAKTAVAGILEAAPAAQVEILPLDLSSLESVAEFGEAMTRDGRPVHLLINNAGVMHPPTRQTTRDGFELQFGTNHLGHFALVAQLLPLLRAGEARVTSQISVAARQGSITWDDLNREQSYDVMRAYSQSKIAFGLFGLELERRSAANDWGITSNISHPGIAPTNLLSARSEIGRDADTMSVRLIRWASARGLVGTPWSAALPAVLAATSSDAVAGKLYGPRGLGHLGGAPAEQALYPTLRSEENARRIWQVSEQLTGTTFPMDSGRREQVR